MKLTAAAKAVVFTGALAALGCQEARPTSPSDASLFIPNLQGVWNGPMTRVGASGGECTGEVIETFLPVLDSGTIAITQKDADTSATMTTESTGLACRYEGTSTLTSVTMNAESCDRTGLIVSCKDGVKRELRLVGSSVIGTWNGNQLTGQASATYNVFDALSSKGVGSLVTTHNFAATRR